MQILELQEGLVSQYVRDNHELLRHLRWSANLNNNVEDILSWLHCRLEDIHQLRMDLDRRIRILEILGISSSSPSSSSSTSNQRRIQLGEFLLAVTRITVSHNEVPLVRSTMIEVG